MIVLVPLSRFRVTYEIAAGRPFSEFERLILRAVQEGASELSELRDAFQVHPRLLIEGLVTLTHAGWVAIGGPGHEGFVLTSEGQEAATSDQPPSTTVVESRHASVVMERISGALIANSEVKFVSKRELRDVWDQVVRLDQEVTANKLDEGQVQHLLPRRQGEWIRWIGPIDMLTKGANWLPVSVDVRTQEVIGLPDSWIPRLKKAVLSKASGVKETKFARGIASSVDLPVIRQKRPRAAGDEREPERLQLPELSRPVSVSEEDFVFTTVEHENLMTRAMNEARSSLLIASPCPSIRRLDFLRGDLEGALRRGVNVDLLFGQTTRGEHEFATARDWCSRLAYDTKQDGGGCLRFSRQPSNYHGNLLLWDDQSGCNACVGSFDWLALSVGQKGSRILRDVTIRISDPGIAATLVRCAIGSWSDVETASLSSTADRWRSIAAELDMKSLQESPDDSNATMRVVLDGDHGVLVDSGRTEAHQRVFVTAKQLETLSQILPVDGDADSGKMASVDVMYQRSERDQAWISDASYRLGEMGGSLKKVDSFRGEVLITNATVCITSYNFLSAVVDVVSSGGREIGVVIEGQETVGWILKKLKSELV